MEKEKLITIIFALIIFGLIGVVVWGSLKKKNVSIEMSKDKIVLYYGITCPHCKEVEEWMNKNNVKQKLTILEKEVYENRINNAELVKAAESCGLDTSKIGVPFLYAQGKCYMGAPEVIQFLAEKAGVELKEASSSANLEASGSAIE